MKEDLQAELIIPRSPSPDPVAHNPRSRNSRNGRISKDAKLAQLKVEFTSGEFASITILTELQKEIEEIKAEPEDGPRGRKRVSDVAEASGSGSGRPFKTSRGPSGNVIIDLTDD